MSRLIYPYYVSLKDVDEVVESGGTLIQGRIFVTLDDATFAGSPAQQKKLKSFISAQTVEINEKYVKKYIIPMYARLYLTTNDEHVAVIEPGDRRYLVIQALVEWERVHAKNEDYFDKLVGLSNSPKFLGKLKHALSAITPEMLDLTWDSLHTAPMTDAKEEQLAFSMNHAQRCLYELFTTGLAIDDETVPGWKINKKMPYSWHELNNIVDDYVSKKDQRNYEKSHLEASLTAFGCEEIIPVYHAGKAIANEDFTRKEGLDNMLKFGIISKISYDRFINMGNSMMKQTGKKDYKIAKAGYGV